MATGDASQEIPFERVGTPATDSLTVVALGASARGIQALQTFFAALPAHPGIAFVIIMHLSSTHEGHLTQVLQVHTAIPVTQVQGIKLENRAHYPA